jgi:hypothetical protein
MCAECDIKCAECGMVECGTAAAWPPLYMPPAL